MGGQGFGFFSMLAVLADDSSRALPVWLNGPEGHDLFQGPEDHPHPEFAEVITAGLLRAAGVTMTSVDIDELDPALITGPGGDGTRRRPRGSSSPQQASLSPSR